MGHVHEYPDGDRQVGRGQCALALRPDVGERIVAGVHTRRTALILPRSTVHARHTTTTMPNQ